MGNGFRPGAQKRGRGATGQRNFIDLGIDHGFEAGDLLPGSDFCCSSFFRGFCAGLGAVQRRGEGVAVVGLGACALGFVCCPLECACCKGKRFNNRTEKANRARA